MRAAPVLLLVSFQFGTDDANDHHEDYETDLNENNK